jgi:hypothetical protein
MMFVIHLKSHTHVLIPLQRSCHLRQSPKIFVTIWYLLKKQIIAGVYSYFEPIKNTKYGLLDRIWCSLEPCSGQEIMVNPSGRGPADSQPNF